MASARSLCSALLMAASALGPCTGALSRRGLTRVSAATRLSGALLLPLLGAGACSPIPYEPQLATDPYPRQLHTPERIVDIEVFRDGDTLVLVNATPTSYQNVRVWLNQRFMLEVESIPAGQKTHLPLSGFWDRWGGSPERGGLLRRFDPTPIRLAQIEVDANSPLVGLVVIPAEEPRTPRQLQG